MYAVVLASPFLSPDLSVVLEDEVVERAGERRGVGRGRDAAAVVVE